MPRSRTAFSSAAWSTTSRARRVDEVRAGLQLVEDRRVHEPLRVGVEREMHAQDVAAFRDLGRRRGELHRDRLVGDLILAGREPPAPDDDRHAEGVGAPRHLLADVAVAEQAERAAVETARFRVLLLVPACRRADPRRCRARADRARAQREGELRDRDRVLARAVRDVDPAPGRGRDVDRVVAGAGADDERRASRLRASRRSPRVLRTTSTSAAVSRSACVSASSFRSG